MSSKPSKLECKSNIPKVVPRPFPSTKDVGLSVQWRKKNFGFGSFEFYMCKKDKKLHIQHECTNREFIKEMLGVMVDNAVMD